MVRICLQRRETIHPAAENVAKRHLGTPRRETVDLVGKEVLLFRCVSGKEAESVIAMDLPFQIFIPFGRGGEETNRRIPPASLQLPSRIAETFYELVVTVQQGSSAQNRYTFPIPLQRYDTLSTFGMYNRPETRAATADHIVTLGISLPKWSYGPLDPITVYVKLSPNPDYLNKAKRVTIQKLTLTIEEEITFNPEGDEPTKKINKIAKHTQAVGTKMPETGYITNLGLVLPSRDLRDPDGIIKRGKPAFPMYEVTSFSTSSTLYKIEFFLSIKVSFAHSLTRRLTVLLTQVPGAHDLREGYHTTPADRGVPHGPTSLQGRDGCHRAGRQGCRPCGPEQPCSARSNDYSGQREGGDPTSWIVRGGRSQEDADRMTL